MAWSWSWCSLKKGCVPDLGKVYDAGLYLEEGCAAFGEHEGMAMRLADWAELPVKIQVYFIILLVRARSNHGFI